ncbi:MAG: hypothetical protein ABJN14_11680 [Paracoccaceae bacterium]
MFVVGAGRVHADEVVEGDRIRNADLRELAVLSVDLDPRPQIVHNLEIAGPTPTLPESLRLGGITKLLKSGLD